MTDFSKTELLRLVGKIPETDPTTPAYHVLLQSIECLNALALTVDEILALRDGNTSADQSSQQEATARKTQVVEFTPPTEPVKDGETEEDPEPETTSAEPVEAPAPAVPVEEKTYAASDVRKALVEVRAKGHEVREILAEFGVTDFRALPESKYGKLMQKLEAM